MCENNSTNNLEQIVYDLKQFSLSIALTCIIFKSDYISVFIRNYRKGRSKSIMTYTTLLEVIFHDAYITAAPFLDLQVHRFIKLLFWNML